jgi:hypothetical protein
MSYKNGGLIFLRYVYIYWRVVVGLKNGAIFLYVITEFNGGIIFCNREKGAYNK